MTQDVKVINFMGPRHFASAFSILLLIASIASLAINGLKLGLDFTGGSQVEIALDRPADIPAIRQVLVDEGLSNPVAVLFGSERDVLIRTQGSMEEAGANNLRQAVQRLNSEAELLGVGAAPREQESYAQTLRFQGVSAEDLRQASIFTNESYGAFSLETQGQETLVHIGRSLDVVYTAQLLKRVGEATGAQISLSRSEFVGPQIGEELRDDGGLGILCALIVVMLYVAVRFQYKFAVAAVAALMHDVIIVLGIFSITQKDFDLTVLAAVLAVIGYSINDTIVVFDRIRDNFRTLRKTEPADVINVSLSQTLERTLLTSLTTLLTLVVLYIFGGELINGFAFALIVGISVGTYSSVYIAANILMAMGVTREDLVPTVRETSEIDELP